MAAVGDPPRPRVVTATRRGPRQLFQATSTPEKLRLLIVGFIVVCLAWGAVAAWVVNQRASGASQVVSVSEPLSLDGQQIYRALSDADATADSAFLVGGLEPFAAYRRYQADIAQAGAHLESATAAAGHSAATRYLLTLSTALPVYTGEIQTAQAYNRIGYPLGAAYLREASALMRGTLLPAARNVYTQANDQLAAASGQATGLPTALVLLAAAIVLGYAMFRVQRWLFRHTHRLINPGLAVASAAAVLSLLWLAGAMFIARADLLHARAHGSAPAEALAQADIQALRARADESLTLIDGAGDDNFQADFVTVQHGLGPGPGSLLTSAVAGSQGSPGAGYAAKAAAAATAWYRVHKTVRFLDDNSQHVQAVQLVTTSGPDHSGTVFAGLDGSLTRAIGADQVVFHSKAKAGRDAFTGLEIGVIVLAVIMAAGCAYGLAERLAEYR